MDWDLKINVYYLFYFFYVLQFHNFIVKGKKEFL